MACCSGTWSRALQSVAILRTTWRRGERKWRPFYLYLWLLSVNSHREQWLHLSFSWVVIVYGCNALIVGAIYTVCMFAWDSLKFITCELNMIPRWNLRQSTSFAESQKTLEAHGCKPRATNLSIVPHTLGKLNTNMTYCITLLEYVNESQMNMYTV